MTGMATQSLTVASTTVSLSQRALPVGLFVLAMAFAWGLAYVPVSQAYGWRGVAMTSLSWLLVTAGGLVSLVVSAWYAGSVNSSLANLLGLLPRMFIPLVGLIGLQSYADWSQVGGAGMLLAYYFVSLITETCLTVKYYTPHTGKRLVTVDLPQA
jgi:vacuolar-type H+-ATPase subunit I/STV1